MRLRNLSAHHAGLMNVFLCLIFALFVHTRVLGAEEKLPSSADPAYPLAAALGVQFVEGSDSSLILERDGRLYVVDLATRSIRENDASVQVASANAQQAPLAPAAPGGSSGAAIFQQQCASCHGSNGRGLATASTPDLTDSRARAGVPLQAIVDNVMNGKP